MKLSIDNLHPGILTILGVPSDENSSFLRGAALAPEKIRQALHSPSSNLGTENGMDLGEELRLRDLGDLAFEHGCPELEQIEPQVRPILQQGARIIALGGDHAITFPLVQAHQKVYPTLNILHLDAHPDLYDEFEGSRTSHACPFARIMEQGLAKRLVQVGIRTLNDHLRQQAVRFGVEIVEMRAWQPDMHLEFSEPVYLSLDLDVLDPAFAPGVSHHEPGGLSTREVIRLLQNLRAQVIGADIVEYNPLRDLNGVTAMAAAKLLKEIAALMFRS